MRDLHRFQALKAKLERALLDMPLFDPDEREDLYVAIEKFLSIHLRGLRARRTVLQQRAIKTCRGLDDRWPV